MSSADNHKVNNDAVNEYTLEELLPVVAELTAKYTGNESTSVTYEKAEQLMGAVLYCIGEYEASYSEHASLHSSKIINNELRENRKISAGEAYLTGYQNVLQKVVDTFRFYNEMIIRFYAYGNENYRDTVEKGIPGFFKWYNPQFAPQDSIITMDYPTICRIEGSTGIDAIAQYLKYIALEQEFLGKFSEEYVIDTLTAYHADYRWQFDNICSIVLRDILIKMVKPKNISMMDFEKMCVPENREELEERLNEQLKRLIQEKYENNQPLFDYLKEDIKDIGAMLTRYAR